MSHPGAWVYAEERIERFKQNWRDLIEIAQKRCGRPRFGTTMVERIEYRDRLLKYQARELARAWMRGG